MKNKELHSEFTFQIEPKHYFKHNYLTYCNDVLVSMLKYADEEKMASVSIDLGNGENIEFEQDEKWQEWLITHGHRTKYIIGTLSFHLLRIFVAICLSR